MFSKSYISNDYLSMLMSSLNLSVNRDWFYLKWTMQKTCPSWLTLHSKSKWCTLTVRQVFCMNPNIRMTIKSLGMTSETWLRLTLLTPRHDTGCNCPPHRERQSLPRPCSHQDSNPDLPVRGRPFSPLNYKNIYYLILAIACSTATWETSSQPVSHYKPASWISVYLYT